MNYIAAIQTQFLVELKSLLQGALNITYRFGGGRSLRDYKFFRSYSGSRAKSATWRLRSPWAVSDSLSLHERLFVRFQLTLIIESRSHCIPRSPINAVSPQQSTQWYTFRNHRYYQAVWQLCNAIILQSPLWVFMNIFTRPNLSTLPWALFLSQLWEKLIQSNTIRS